MREVDFLVVLVPLIHREIDDPAESRRHPSSLDRARRQCAARHAGELLRRGSSSPAEKNTASPSVTPALAAIRRRLREEFRDWANRFDAQTSERSSSASVTRPCARARGNELTIDTGERAAFVIEDHIAQPRRAFAPGPVVRFVEEAPRLSGGAWRGDGAHGLAFEKALKPTSSRANLNVGDDQSALRKSGLSVPCSASPRGKKCAEISA